MKIGKENSGIFPSLPDFRFGKLATLFSVFPKWEISAIFPFSSTREISEIFPLFSRFGRNLPLLHRGIRTSFPRVRGVKEGGLTLCPPSSLPLSSDKNF